MADEASGGDAPQPEDEVEVTWDAGRPVRNEDGDHLGVLVVVLVDEDTDEAAFLLVADAVDAAEGRLVPAEIVEGMDNDHIVLDVTVDEFEQLPRIEQERDPAPAEIALAYRVLRIEEA